MKDLKGKNYFAVFKSDKSLDFKPRLFEGQPTKANLLRMMDYVNFVHVHELFRYSFQDFCENQEDESEEKLPIVCFIALNNEFKSQLLEKFKDVIHSMEEEVYQ